MGRIGQGWAGGGTFLDTVLFGNRRYHLRSCTGSFEKMWGTHSTKPRIYTCRGWVYNCKYLFVKSSMNGRIGGEGTRTFEHKHFVNWQKVVKLLQQWFDDFSFNFAFVFQFGWIHNICYSILIIVCLISNQVY